MSSDPSWTMLAGSLTYEPWGSITSAQFGNGLSLSQTWTDGRLASKRLYATATGANLSQLAYLYDNDDNIGAIRDLVDDSKSAYYGYDGNNRLNFASMTVGTPATGAETYNYTSGKNRLASVTNASGTRSIGYDGRGNTTSETRPGSVTVSTSYDGYGRLLTYARTGDPAQANAYNGLDDRVSVTSGSTTHAFVYDPDGRLIGEYGASGSPIAETIWLSPEVANDNAPFGGDDGIGGYAPLAIVTGSGASAALYWVHGNHLGVPLVTTDASGAVATPSGYTPVGFPGQTKTLADLYYNRYRDYDSSLGRYIQADPIGLAGGENPYVYANNNPLRYMDPSGRCPWCVAGAALFIGGAIEGAIIDYLIQKYWDKRQCIDNRELLESALLGGAGSVVGSAAAPYIGRAARWAGGKAAPRLGRAGRGIAGKGGADAGGAGGGAGGANAASAAKLSKQLQSEEGVSELLSGGGKSIAGAGSDVPVQDLERLIAEYGGNPGDWSKITSTATGHIQTHAYKNIVTGEIVDLKSIP